MFIQFCFNDKNLKKFTFLYFSCTCLMLVDAKKKNLMLRNYSYSKETYNVTEIFSNNEFLEKKTNYSLKKLIKHLPLDML